jgi:DNA primase
MSIPQATIEAIRERVNIADIISETVQLKRSGRSLLGLCPFHNEKTPSFSVNDQDGFYHCFGCSKHGSVFDFVMETRGLTFVEAVKFLGRRVGIEVQSESPERAKERSLQEERRRELRSLLKSVVNHYRQRLAFSVEARNYCLRERGLTEESLAAFELGWCDGDIESLFKACGGNDRKLVEKQLIELGVLGRSDDGSLYETFRGRVIFPIQRSDGTPVALGGRILEKDSNRPKYINSKESLIYSKRQTLYGLFQSLPYLRKHREVLLVEGYLDVISLFQEGYPFAVATCGTSVTGEHVELLRRFCNRLTCIFDADPAGQKAAANCFELFLNSGIEVSTLRLPEGEDPASFLIGKAENRTVFESLPRSSALETFLSYQLSLTDKSAAALGRVSTDFRRITSGLTNPVEREATLREGAKIMGVSFESLTSIQAKRKHSPHRSRPQSAPTHPPAQLRSRSQIRLSIYLEQMFVSVICTPALCRELLQMGDSLRQIATPEFPLERICGILHTIDEGEFVALENFRGRARTKEFADYLVHWKRLLSSFNLDAKRLLSLAWNQVVVGGANPQSVINDLARVQTEISIHAQVERIQVLERERPNDRSELIQQKLLEKRNLVRKAAS